MNSSRLWNSHQRHKFLRAEASRDILKVRVSEMAFPEVFKRDFPPRTPSFLDIAQFERFTDLNLLEYVFKTGKRMLYNFIQWCLFFVSSYSSRR